jgi:hypothetical protein
MLIAFWIGNEYISYKVTFRFTARGIVRHIEDRSWKRAPGEDVPDRTELCSLEKFLEFYEAHEEEYMSGWSEPLGRLVVAKLQILAPEERGSKLRTFLAQRKRMTKKVINKFLS